MGNSIGGRKKRVKVMKVDGEILKLKLPIRVSEVLKDYPDHVLLESEAVKHYGVKAKPLEPQQDLNRKKIYFLLQLPKIAQPPLERIPRRVRSSGVNMSAKDRLDLLMLSRRTMSEVTINRPSPATASSAEPRFHSGPMQVKMKIPRSQVAKLMEESRNEGEVAEKIINMYLKNEVNCGGGSGGASDVDTSRQPEQWKPSLVSSVKENTKAHREAAFLKPQLHAPDEKGRCRQRVCQIRPRFRGFSSMGSQIRKLNMLPSSLEFRGSSFTDVCLRSNWEFCSLPVNLGLERQV